MLVGGVCGQRLLLQELPGIAIDARGQIIVPMVMPRHFSELNGKARSVQLVPRRADRREREIFVPCPDPDGHWDLALSMLNQPYLAGWQGAGVNSRRGEISRFQQRDLDRKARSC